MGCRAGGKAAFCLCISLNTACLTARSSQPSGTSMILVLGLLLSTRSSHEPGYTGIALRCAHGFPLILLCCFGVPVPQDLQVFSPARKHRKKHTSE